MSTWSKSFMTSSLLFSTLLLVGSVVTLGAGKGSAPSTERTTNMKIQIRIADRVIIASVADNATARDFVSRLPLSVSMKDLFGREKYGDLPKPLSEKGPGRKCTKSATLLTGLRPTRSPSTTTRMERRYLHPASSQSQRSMRAQKRSTYRDR